MERDQPSPFFMFMGLMTLGWAVMALDAYIRVNIIGALQALCAGGTYFYVMRTAKSGKELPWLFGWNDSFVAATIRQSVMAMIFVGPVIRHAGLWVFPEVSNSQLIYLPILLSAVLLGLFFVVFVRRKEKDGI